MGRKRKSRHDLPRRVYQRHGAFYFVDTAGKWHHLGRDFATAMTPYGVLNSAPRESQTMAPLFDRYQLEIVPTKAPRTQRDNLRELALLRRAFGDMRPADITPQDIYAYMGARRAPVRANREKSLLSHVFSYAIRWGACADNPCRLVKSNPEKARDRYVADAEFQAVYDVASAPVRVAMMLTR